MPESEDYAEFVSNVTYKSDYEFYVVFMRICLEMGITDIRHRIDKKQPERLKWFVMVNGVKICNPSPTGLVKDIISARSSNV